MDVLGVVLVEAWTMIRPKSKVPTNNDRTLTIDTTIFDFLIREFLFKIIACSK